MISDFSVNQEGYRPRSFSQDIENMEQTEVQDGTVIVPCFILIIQFNLDRTLGLKIYG